MRAIMNEKVLGVIRANRPTSVRLIQETLFFTPDRVVVARTSGGLGMAFGAVAAGLEAYKGIKKEKEYLELSLQEILEIDKDNFALPYFEITKVELKKGWLKQPKLSIILSREVSKEKKYEWNLMGLIVPEKGVKFEDYENTLRPIFGDRLSVKK